MKHCWGKVLSLLIAFFLMGGFALAQVGVKASVEGTVTDETGAVLPGVTVTLEGPMGAMVYVTTETGKYRFKALEIGVYKLTFELEGFETYVREGLELKTAFTATVNVILRIAAVREAITVVARSEMVDLKRSEITTNFGMEVLQGIPNARDPWVIIDKAPGVTVQRPNVGGDQSGQQTGFRAHASPGDQTGYLMDGGLITEHAAIGSTPTYYNFDSFAEVQVTTGGFDITSRGGGGVTVNLVTKTGGNEFHGQGGFYFINESLQGNNVGAAEEERGLNPHDMRIKKNLDYGVDIGGPILRDKMWFWGSAQEGRIGRYFPVIDPATGDYAFGTTKLTNLNVKFIWRPVEDNQFSFYYQWGDKNWPTRSRGNGTNPQDDPDAYHVQSGPSPYYRVDDQHYWNPDFFTSLRFGALNGYFHLAPQDMGWLTSRQALRDRDINKLFNVAQYDYDTTRPQREFDIDNNIYVDEWLGGSHEFRVGFQHRRAGVRSLTIYPQGMYIYYYGEGSHFNYVDMLPEQVGCDYFIRMTGFYFKDTYTRERFSLNFGFRYDMATGGRKGMSFDPNPWGDYYSVGPSDPGNPESFNWKNFLPRFGFNYDLTGDGKTAFRINIAKYAAFPSTGVGGFGNVIYGIDNLFFWDDDGDTVVEQDELTLWYRTYDPADPLARAATYRTVDEYGAPRTWEVLAGFDREIMEDLALTITYHYRHLDNFTWYWNYLPDWSDYVSLDDWTPEQVTYDSKYSGESYSGTVYHWNKPGAYTDYYARERTNYHDYYVKYQGVDIVLTKRYSNKWMASAALTLGRASRHWPKGLEGEMVDYPEDQGLKDGGIYGDSIPWMLKLTGSYEFPYGIRFGAFVNTRKGFPENDTFPASKWTGSTYRTRYIDCYKPGERYNDTYFCMDLRFEKTFDLGPGRLHGIVDLFNLTNSVPVLRSYYNVNRSYYNEARFPYTLGARAIRFAARYSF